jgi:predicted nucleic acid-binding protein
MSDRIFLDTNIIIYSFDVKESKKQSIAKEDLSHLQKIENLTIINPFLEV